MAVIPPLSAAQLAEIRARIHPSEEGKLAFGGQILDSLEAYAKVRVRTTGAELDTAINRLVDTYVPLQRDAERLLAEVERLKPESDALREIQRWFSDRRMGTTMGSIECRRHARRLESEHAGLAAGLDFIADRLELVDSDEERALRAAQHIGARS